MRISWLGGSGSNDEASESRDTTIEDWSGEAEGSAYAVADGDGAESLDYDELREAGPDEPWNDEVGRAFKNLNATRNADGMFQGVHVSVMLSREQKTMTDDPMWRIKVELTDEVLAVSNKTVLGHTDKAYATNRFETLVDRYDLEERDRA